MWFYFLHNAKCPQNVQFRCTLSQLLTVQFVHCDKHEALCESNLRINSQVYQTMSWNVMKYDFCNYAKIQEMARRPNEGDFYKLLVADGDGPLEDRKF